MALKLNGTNSVAAPAYAGADADTGLQCGTDEVNLVTGGTARLYIDSSGNVGIGTTSPTSLGSGFKEVIVSGTTEGAGLQLQDTDGNVKAGLFTSDVSGAAFVRTITNHPLAFRTNNTERMRIDTSGQVGIGTASPSQQLHIASANTSSSGTIIASDSQGRGVLIESPYIGNAVGKIGISGTDSALAFGTGSGNTERMRIDTSGHLLVGGSAEIRSGNIEVIQSSADAEINVTESSDAGNGPKLRLTRTRGSNVSSPTAISNGNFMGSILFDSYDSANYRIGAQIQAIASGNWSSGSCPTDLYFSTTASGQSSPTERLRIDNSGKINIGTTSATQKVSVGTSASETLGYSVDWTGSGAGQVASFTANTSTGEVRIGATNTSGTYFPTFYSNNSERMRIASNGRVGIGTSSPLARTHLDGTDNDVDNVLFLTAANLANGAGGRISFGGNYDGTNRTSWADIKGSKENATSGQYGGYLSFSTRPNGGSNTERVRITSGGTLMVGTTGSNNPGVEIYKESSAIGRIDVYKTYSGSANALACFHNGSYVGGVQYANSSTSFQTSSDARLKENISNIDGAITRIKQLSPKRFNFIIEPDVIVDGFLAHEAQTVVPEAVSGTHNEVDADGNPVYQGIDQSKLVPLLTAALQEAIGKIETLETQNADLLARVTALEAA
jgi:uncharacterized protein YaiE (UPF0345 family)